MSRIPPGTSNQNSSDVERFTPISWTQILNYNKLSHYQSTVENEISKLDFSVPTRVFQFDNFRVRLTPILIANKDSKSDSPWRSDPVQWNSTRQDTVVAITSIIRDSTMNDPRQKKVYEETALLVERNIFYGSESVEEYKERGVHLIMKIVLVIAMSERHSVKPSDPRLSVFMNAISAPAQTKPPQNLNTSAASNSSALVNSNVSGSNRNIHPASTGRSSTVAQQIEAELVGKPQELVLKSVDLLRGLQKTRSLVFDSFTMCNQPTQMGARLHALLEAAVCPHNYVSNVLGPCDVNIFHTWGAEHARENKNTPYNLEHKNQCLNYFHAMTVYKSKDETASGPHINSTKFCMNHWKNCKSPVKCIACLSVLPDYLVQYDYGVGVCDPEHPLYEIWKIDLASKDIPAPMKQHLNRKALHIGNIMKPKWFPFDHAAYPGNSSSDPSQWTQLHDSTGAVVNSSIDILLPFLQYHCTYVQTNCMQFNQLEALTKQIMGLFATTDTQLAETLAALPPIVESLRNMNFTNPVSLQQILKSLSTAMVAINLVRTQAASTGKDMNAQLLQLVFQTLTAGLTPHLGSNLLGNAAHGAGHGHGHSGIGSSSHGPGSLLGHGPGPNGSLVSRKNMGRSDSEIYEQAKALLRDLRAPMAVGKRDRRGLMKDIVTTVNRHVPVEEVARRLGINYTAQMWDPRYHPYVFQRIEERIKVSPDGKPGGTIILYPMALPHPTESGKSLIFPTGLDINRVNDIDFLQLLCMENLKRQIAGRASTVPSNQDLKEAVETMAKMVRERQLAKEKETLGNNRAFTPTDEASLLPILFRANLAILSVPPSEDLQKLVLASLALAFHPAPSITLKPPPQYNVEVIEHSLEEPIVPILERLKSSYLSLLYTMTKEQLWMHVFAHFDDFNADVTADAIRNRLNPILASLKSNDPGGIFAEPVDPEKSSAIDYLDVIKQPMDFGTIQKRLDSSVYTTYNAVASDIRLVCTNAKTYNAKDHHIYKLADQILSLFEDYYKVVRRDWFEEWTAKRKNPANCSICGGGAFPYEPQTLYCNTCSARIKKSSTYFTVAGNKYHWCSTCYTNTLKKESTITVDNKVIEVSSITKKKMDASQTEDMVQCSCCKRWMHNVCSLFNTKCNDPDEPMYCVWCIIKFLDDNKQFTTFSEPEPRFAANLEHSNIGREIEVKLARFIESKKDDSRESPELQRLLPLLDTYSSRRTNDGALTVRMVYHSEKSFLTPPEFLQRYKICKFPAQMNYRSKCFVLWQRNINIDVLLYTIYVQEFGNDCPGPNRLCAYLSYLDSVKYFEPSYLRTEIFKEVLIAYLDNIKKRGFNQITIWSCPPQKGDDYIIYVHPERQRTPKPEMLRGWYLSLLEEAQRRNIVEKIVYLVDDYFPSLAGHEGGIDRAMTEIPLFERDYIADQTEVEAKKVREAGEGVFNPNTVPPATTPSASGAAASATAPTGENPEELPTEETAKPGEEEEEEEEVEVMVDGVSQKAPTGKAFGKDSKSSGVRRGGRSKSRGKRRGTRAGSSIASSKPAAPAAKKAVGLDGEPLPEDKVRTKMGENLKAMRCDFIVAKLRASCQWCKRYITGEEGLETKYHCLSCEKLPPRDLEDLNGGPGYLHFHREMVSQNSEMAIDAATGALTTAAAPTAPTTTHGRGGGRRGLSSISKAHQHVHGKEIQHGEPIKVSTDLCPSCYAREKADEENDRPGLLRHRHSVKDFIPVSIDANPILVRQDASTFGRTPMNSSTVKQETPVASGSSKAPGSSLALVKSTGLNSTLAPSTTNALNDTTTNLEASLVDDREIDSLFFKTRLSFLTLCQGNHYQFDQLRRAKHSSSMVLYHMHKPFAPSFVHSCNYCDRNILTVRYNCAICDDYDICEDCHAQMLRNEKPKHEHELQSYEVTGVAAERTMEEKLQFEHKYTRLFDHMSYCTDSSHSSVPVFAATAITNSSDANKLNSSSTSATSSSSQKPHIVDVSTADCTKMRSIMDHMRTCPRARMYVLKEDPPASVNLAQVPPCDCVKLAVALRNHAADCRLPEDVCLVPWCKERKERTRTTGGGNTMDSRRRMMANLKASGKDVTEKPSNDEDVKPEGGSNSKSGNPEVVNASVLNNSSSNLAASSSGANNTSIASVSSTGVVQAPSTLTTRNGIRRDNFNQYITVLRENPDYCPRVDAFHANKSSNESYMKEFNTCVRESLEFALEYDQALAREKGLRIPTSVNELSEEAKKMNERINVFRFIQILKAKSKATGEEAQQAAAAAAQPAT